MCSLHDDDKEGMLDIPKFLQQQATEGDGAIDLAATRLAQEALASQVKRLLEAFNALSPELRTQFLSLMRATANLENS